MESEILEILKELSEDFACICAQLGDDVKTWGSYNRARAILAETEE